LSFSEIITTPFGLQLLIRPIQIYEIPKPKILKTNCQFDFVNISNNAEICYLDNENVRSNQSNNLIKNDINLNLSYSNNTTRKIDNQFMSQPLVLLNSKFNNLLNRRKQKN